MKGIEANRKLIMLSVTDRCNLDCLYCYENAKTAKSMDLALAKEVVEYEFAHSDGFDEIEFDLFGGEPTIHKEFIIALVEWTIAKRFNKPFLFFLQTNGTLVHGDFQKWLLKNKETVYVGLSLDGMPETHNHNRSGSYNKIDINFFVDNYSHQGVRMTVYSDTISNLSKDIIHLHSLGFDRVDVFFAHGVNWNVEDLERVLEREYRLLSDWYLSHPDIKECSLFDMSLTRLVRKEGINERWCGTGTNIVSISVDGKRYPCQTFQPNTNPHPLEIGTVDFAAIADFSDPECKGCAVEPICPNCYGINYLKTGNMLKRDKSICTITKLQALAVSYLRGMQISKNSKKMEPSETYQWLEAISLVQKYCA